MTWTRSVNALIGGTKTAIEINDGFRQVSGTDMPSWFGMAFYYFQYSGCRFPFRNSVILFFAHVGTRLAKREQYDDI
ncbi:hypothetical protein [Chitinophaga sp.]|uniref:hypothetical protein n=1 Tax=Chitinophaga sp. TaxID=1869181 RepID=UPI0031D4A8CC